VLTRTASENEPSITTPFIYDRSLEAVWGAPGLYNADSLFKRIESGTITLRDLKIVEALFRHQYLTLQQIQSMFFPDASRIRTVGDRLAKLGKMGILRELRWKRNGRLTHTRVFLLDVGGAALLELYLGKQFGDWHPRTLKRALSYVFSILEANDLYMRLYQFAEELNGSGGISIPEIEPVLSLGKTASLGPMKFKTVIPTLSFEFWREFKPGETLNINFLIEVVRSSDHNISFLTTKLRLYEHWFMSNPQKKTVLVFMTENEVQIREINKIIKALGFRTIEPLVRYSTDVMAGGSLSRFLVQFDSQDNLVAKTINLFKPVVVPDILS